MKNTNIKYVVCIHHFLRKQNEALKKQLNEKNSTVTTNEPNDVAAAQALDKIELSVIGTIKTKFKERRCVPRQPGLCPLAQARLTISNTVFTNPNHALEGLADFSHMWYVHLLNRNLSGTYDYR